MENAILEVWLKGFVFVRLTSDACVTVIQVKAPSLGSCVFQVFEDSSLSRTGRMGVLEWAG